MYKYEGKLVNESLRNVDPRSSELSDQEKRDILLECKVNLKYFMNTVLFDKKESPLYKICISLVEENEKWL